MDPITGRELVRGTWTYTIEICMKRKRKMQKLCDIETNCPNEHRALAFALKTFLTPTERNDVRKTEVMRKANFPDEWRPAAKLIGRFIRQRFAKRAIRNACQPFTNGKPVDKEWASFDCSVLRKVLRHYDGDLFALPSIYWEADKLKDAVAMHRHSPMWFLASNRNYTGIGQDLSDQYPQLADRVHNIVDLLTRRQNACMEALGNDESNAQSVMDIRVTLGDEYALTDEHEMWAKVFWNVATLVAARQVLVCLSKTWV